MQVNFLLLKTSVLQAVKKRLKEPISVHLIDAAHLDYSYPITKSSNWTAAIDTHMILLQLHNKTNKFSNLIGYH